MSEAATPGPIEHRLRELLRAGPIHFTLIDPEKSPGEAAGEIAQGAVAAGSHVVLLGGSTGISREGMAAAAAAVKARVKVPVIIFPEGPGSLAPGPDAILFMSLLNSRNLDLVVRTHAKTSLAIRKLGLEPIPLGYLVVAPGMRVGEVGEVDAVPRDRPDVAQGFALAAEFLGMRLLYLEAGSGAPSPVPAEMVHAVREILSIPLIVGGGIRSGRDARTLLDAGAQILVTGSVVEEQGLSRGYREIVSEVNRDRDGS